MLEFSNSELFLGHVRSSATREFPSSPWCKFGFVSRKC